MNGTRATPKACVRSQLMEPDQIPALNRGRTATLSRPQLLRVKRREVDGLAAFFDTYFDRTYGLICRLVGDRSLAEDLTQEVFLRVHRASDSLDPERDPWRWLVTIAYNVCRDHWGSSATRNKKSTRDMEPGLLDAVHDDPRTPGPQAAALDEEAASLVRSAVAALPFESRAVVVLHDFDGLTHEEIAKLTGSKATAVRKQYSRSLSKLADLLKERGL